MIEGFLLRYFYKIRSTANNISIFRIGCKFDTPANICSSYDGWYQKLLCCRDRIDLIQPPPCLTE